jgi:hypothetical protein
MELNVFTFTDGSSKLYLVDVMFSHVLHSSWELYTSQVPFIINAPRGIICPDTHDLLQVFYPIKNMCSIFLSFNNRTIKILLLWVVWWWYVSLHCSLCLLLWLKGSAGDKNNALLSVSLLAVNYWCCRMSQHLICHLDISFWHHRSCFLHQHFKIIFGQSSCWYWWQNADNTVTY